MSIFYQETSVKSYSTPWSPVSNGKGGVTSKRPEKSPVICLCCPFQKSAEKMTESQMTDEEGCG